jgi:SAM-dependent methyltransferase
MQRFRCYTADGVREPTAVSSISKEEFYRERAKTYPFEDAEAVIRYRRAIDWMNLDGPLSIREVGCKFSVIFDLLKRTGCHFDYRALDIDFETLQRIPGYDPKLFLQHNANSGLPFDSASADYIVCLEVMEHLENPTHFLAEAERVLHPGGKMILSVPNAYCWMEFLDNLRRTCDTEGHVATFTHQNIDALLGFCGMRLRDVKGTFTRIPFSRRLFGKYTLLQTDNLLLTRSFMYLIEKPARGA